MLNFRIYTAKHNIYIYAYTYAYTYHISSNLGCLSIDAVRRPVSFVQQCFACPSRDWRASALLHSHSTKAAPLPQQVWRPISRVTWGTCHVVCRAFAQCTVIINKCWSCQTNQHLLDLQIGEQLAACLAPASCCSYKTTELRCTASAFKDQDITILFRGI